MSGVPGAAAEWSQTTRGADVVVEARDVVRVYGAGEARVVALGGVSLSVERGQFVAVMGPSGSGKSTLLHCLAGLDTPTSGSVLIAGQDLAGMNDKQLTRVRRDRLGFVFQAFNLLPTLSAEENILLPLRLARRRPDEQWYRAVIDALGIADRLDHRPSQLSGGQQQRVAVARALAGRPEVVFADEPTGALDTASAASLLQALAAMCRNLGQTVVMVTHDENAAATTNRIIRLTDGRITTDNPTHHTAHHAARPARGVSVRRLRIGLFIGVSLAVAASVSAGGPVGLMGTHICRRLVGPVHRTLVVASALFGGAFLVACDTAARTLWAPAEIPVGVLTSCMGASFFLWLLLRRERHER